MDVSLLVTRRLRELGLGQRDLAEAAGVSESYVSQLLSRKKAPPAPGRTDIYEKMERLLRLQPGELARLARLQRVAELARGLAGEPAPLYPELRAMLLRKCAPDQAVAVQAVFERQPYGELERLTIRALLEATRPVARQTLPDERLVRTIARRGHRGYEEMRVAILELLETERSAVTISSYTTVLDPLVESWSVDLVTFDFRIVLSRSLTRSRVCRFGFTARPPGDADPEPGLTAFLDDPTLSGGATEDEIAFLRRLDLRGRRPTPLYYHRELQNLRDPRHFEDAPGAATTHRPVRAPRDNDD